MYSNTALSSARNWSAALAALCLSTLTLCLFPGHGLAAGGVESAMHADATTGTSGADASIERGRYIAKTSGCNDCHTAGYLMGAGQVPEQDWLKGDTFGWRGAWGTTYAPNLRLFISSLSEDEWLQFARHAQLRPPMPWYALRELHEEDLRAFYRFVRSLGEPGEPAPAYLPPEVVPKGPYAQFPSPPPADTTAAIR